MQKLQLGTEKDTVQLRRKIGSIKKWRQLKEIIPFSVLQINSMDVASIKGKKKQTSFYAELQREDGEKFNELKRKVPPIKPWTELEKVDEHEERSS